MWFAKGRGSLLVQVHSKTRSPPLISPCRVCCRLTAFSFYKPQSGSRESTHSHESCKTLNDMTHDVCRNNHRLTRSPAAVCWGDWIIYEHVSLVSILGLWIVQVGVALTVNHVYYELCKDFSKTLRLYVGCHSSLMRDDASNSKINVWCWIMDT